MRPQTVIHLDDLIGGITEGYQSCVNAAAASADEHFDLNAFAIQDAQQS
jgi:hypothetical protein